ncbi:MAG: hypothetical protein OEZ59_10125, partial [Deltaproteobacteria bacterium]|nr:hypothetical protein [Deltaproteobacteria bacterium]
MLPGVAVWIIQAFWPGACVALPCSEGELWPFLFRGGWLSPAQYQLILLFFLPLLGEPLLGGALSGHQGMTRGLLVLAGLLFAGLLAGGHPLGLALAVCGLALVALAAWRSRSRGLMQFSMRASAWGLFITLTFFGLFPGYMGALVAPEESRRQVRLEPVTPPPAEAPSGHNIPVTLKVANTGWISLPAGLGAPPRVAARILFNSGSGETRELPMDSVTLGQPLQPGQSALVNLEITPPHWLKAGYLDWLVLDPAGRALPEHEAGHQGIRLKNTAYQNLAHGPGNRLSSLTRNSREIFSHTRQVEDYQAARRGKTSLAGSMLDTLVFSPLWGLKPAGQTAWAFDRPLPFFPQVLSRYGILGLALVLLVMARTAGALVGIIRRERNRLGWQLALLALALLFAAGWFTPEAGSYHVIWAWFLFFGWTEGRLASFSRTGA